MALLLLELAIEAALIASGKEEYSTSVALVNLLQLLDSAPKVKTGLNWSDNYKKPNIGWKTEEDEYNFLVHKAQEMEDARQRRIMKHYHSRVAEIEAERVKVQRANLTNRKKLIVKLPTRKIDAERLTNQGLPVANRTVVEDPLALRKLEEEKLNAETLARAKLQETRMKEMLENAAEQQAKRLARQQQIQGSENLLSQIQNRASAESANLQQIQLQQQSLIENSEATTAAANAAVLKAEQAQHAKNTIIPVRRLPKSVKYGGGKKSILTMRLMTEFDMTLKEANNMIKLYGI